MTRWRLIFLAGLASLIATSLGAQGLPALFEAAWRGFDTGVYPNGFGPKSIATGDLDGDGDTDVVVGNYFFGGPGISVLKNLGDGTYDLPVRYGAPNNLNVNEVALVDVDGDGDLDAAATITNIYGTQNSVGVWRNNGNGTFGPRVDYMTGPGPAGLLAADVTGDNFPDVVTANSDGASISVLRHNGQIGAAAGFLAPVQFPAGPNSERLAAADLNGDGRLDLAVGGFDYISGNATGIQSILINDGSGAFTKVGEYFSNDSAERAGSTSVALADLDNDGDADLIGGGGADEGSISYGFISVRRNTGGGNFGPRERYRLENFVWVPAQITTGDLNGDGFRDIIAATPSGRASDGYNVLLNNRAGGFGTAVFYHASQQTYATAAVDADHDGDLDVVTVAESSAAITVHKNPGDGIFIVPPRYLVGGFTEAQDAADIDRDGDLDIVTNDDAVRILRNNGDGTFPPATTYTPPRNFADLKLRDLNGDGYPDLLLGPDAEYPPYHFATALNNGNGTFAPGVIRTVNSCGEGTIDAFDLDNDGDLDVVLTEEEGCAGGAQPRIFIFRNDGNQQFTAMAPIVPPGFATGIAGADVNGDGRTDLITSLGQGIGVFPGNGNLTFGPPIISSTRPYKFKVTDLNRDGKVDVGMIVPQDSFGTVYVATALGNGDGTFQPVRQQSGSSVLESAYRISDDIDIADANGDGAPDLLVTNYASNDVSVFLNNGDGALRPHQRYGIGYAPRFSSFADFTGDGIPDIATDFALPPSGFQDVVTVLRGKSTVAPLRLDSAVSRKTQGAAGTFDIALSLVGEPAVECRNGGGNHTLVFTFSTDVVSGTATVTSGTGTAGTPTFSGRTMTVPLSGVADIQTITVTLQGVTDVSSQVLPNTPVSMHLLLGDTTGNKVVNASDIGQTKAQSGQPVTGTNFRNDTNVNGVINASDIGQVKSNSGHSIPGNNMSETKKNAGSE